MTGNIGLTGTYTKTGTKVTDPPQTVVEFDGSASLEIVKGFPAGWVAYDARLTVTKDGWSYDVPLDATKGELLADDLPTLFEDFVTLATTTSLRFNPKTAQGLGWATFPWFRDLQYGQDYPIAFATGRDQFDGVLHLCACDLAQTFRIEGTWASGRDTLVTGVISADAATGDVVIGQIWTDDWVMPVLEFMGDDWIAPVLTVRGSSLDDAATKATRIAISRSIATAPE